MGSVNSLLPNVFTMLLSFGDDAGAEQISRHQNDQLDIVHTQHALPLFNFIGRPELRPGASPPNAVSNKRALDER